MNGTDDAAGEARRMLQTLVGRLAGGERRDGQLEMCEAIATALDVGEHLIVEAGTGVGKSLAYLVPVVLSGRRIVVATARKPLQDQLIRKDIPFLAAALPGGVDAAVLKGRGNYLCLAKLDEATRGGQGELFDDRHPAGLDRLTKWAEVTDSGDLADAPVPVGPGLRSLVTTSSRECPGAADCEHGRDCLAERALARARDAQLVVTNIDLYCLDARNGGSLLDEHAAVVVDEAHELEAIASRTLGLEIGRRRFTWLAAQLRAVLGRDSTEPAAVEQAGDRLVRALTAFSGRRVEPGESSVARALTDAGSAIGGAVESLRKSEGSPETDGRRQRGLLAASALLDDLRAADDPKAGEVAWVTEGEEASLRVAPVDVGPALAALIYKHRTAVLTSATLSVGGSLAPMAHRLGLRPALLDQNDDSGGPGYRDLRVASPFDYRQRALLYCATHLPDPRRAPDRFDAAALEELTRLVEAAGGRTLALFTSHRMLRLAADALSQRFDWRVLVQEGSPEAGLVERFRDDEQACLLATMGYWQGVDVPGPSLSLVVIDRLPFARPGDPLLDARRDAARSQGRDPFGDVDLVLAATLLAQGAGRLIRTTTDRGVVAVLDPRLARASYRSALLESLPPMRRTVDGDEVRKLLASLAHERSPAEREGLSP